MKGRNIIIGLIIFMVGVTSGIIVYDFLEEIRWDPIVEQKEEVLVAEISHEEAVIEAVEKNLSAVVSIVVKKDATLSRQDYLDFFYFYEEIPETIAGGTGFFISSDGIVLTNKHVVRDKNAQYTIITKEGEELEAEVLALDPMQDIAFLKVEGKDFPAVTLGDSSEIRIGQTAIAIGFALAELPNTVSVGVISGIGRRIEATDGRMMEVLEDVIQTDAGINLGNSGGPLLNLEGKVVGINTAKGVRAQNIGFAIPINKAQRAISGVLEEGRIVYPFLGVRYVLVDTTVQRERNLSVDYGALLVYGARGELAIDPGSGAERAGLRAGDIILEFEGRKITVDNSLASIIIKYDPGDEVELKILREGEEKTIKATLGKR